MRIGTGMLTLTCSDQVGPFEGASQLYPVGSSAFAPMSDMSHIQPSDVWSEANQSQMAGSAGTIHMPNSHQHTVVQGRPKSVAARWGQITPPDDSNTSPMSGSKRKDSGQGGLAAETPTKPKLDNSERARIAANSRHARAKKARQPAKAETQDAPSETSDEDDNAGDDKREKYREKNRVAAAKCRQKKKENVETLEDKHRNLAAQNNFMKREERKLRDELSQLRTEALNHVPSNGRCGCSPLHSYNQRQVQALAFGFGTQPAISSPSAGSISSATGSAGGFDMMGGKHSHPGSTPPNLMLHNMPTPTFSQPSNYAFAAVTTPQSMELTTAGAEGHEFSSFLQSSPNGRAGFS